MPTYILLQFDNDNSAYQFADSWAKDSRLGFQPFKIWGIWRKPTSFCVCTGGGSAASKSRTASSSFTRERRYGWWVCTRCRKPTARWASGGQWFSVLGANLLPKSLRPYNEEMSANLESDAVWHGILEDEG